MDTTIDRLKPGDMFIRKDYDNDTDIKIVVALFIIDDEVL